MLTLFSQKYRNICIPRRKPIRDRSIMFSNVRGYLGQTETAHFLSSYFTAGDKYMVYFIGAEAAHGGSHYSARR
jgi:hypothetical protein